MDSTEVRRLWEDQQGEYSPDYYAHYGPNESSEWIHEVLDSSVARDATVLELGCSSGRHLAHLHENGFEDLYGIDINPDAFEVMDEMYPGLAANGTFRVDAIEDAVTDFEDGQFDVVYSVETLQHLHPDTAWVFDDLARITDSLLITVENEGGATDRPQGDPEVNYVNDDVPLYYRNWERIFTERGFEQVDSESGKRDMLRAFRSAQ
ncbi:class I SAM-dependent methyltransferase [Halostella sp. PRR32]|uniref:class I SAM-dependent methyltransferase n=1 Tax=Halostella sp. PRR32 TaxID=3098147 RepID=UPI002B1D0ADB|nr:class I SAM-dependent methyltransferase [Halostella sp. PRR32]